MSLNKIPHSLRGFSCILPKNGRVILLVQNIHCYEKPESGIEYIRQSTNIMILCYLA